MWYMAYSLTSGTWNWMAEIIRTGHDSLSPLSPSPSPINVLIQENPLTFLECGGPHSWRPEPTLRAGVPLLALETRGRCGIRVDTHGAPAKWPERALKCPLPACGLGENFKDPRPLKSDLSCY